MSEISRRDLLAGMAAGLGAQDAAHVHHSVAQAQAQGGYQPKCFNPHEYATLRRLAEMIMPGAGEARAPEFIDVLASGNEDLTEIFTGGLGWLDAVMRRRHAADFVSATPEQQTALLDLIAYRKNETPELGPGIRFFVWARNLVVDAWFSSKAGMDYLGYMGNSAMSEFKVPEEAVRYAVERSPV
jgi:hypothetical protein